MPTLCLLGKGLMLQPGVKRGGYWLGIQWHRHPQLSCPGGRTSGILRKGCWGLLRRAYGASSSLIFIFLIFYYYYFSSLIFTHAFEVR